MRKTVTFDFSDNFVFPEKWSYWANRGCGSCPFHVEFDDEPLCFLTGDCDSEIKHPNCPFYGGADKFDYGSWE